LPPVTFVPLTPTTAATFPTYTPPATYPTYVPPTTTATTLPTTGAPLTVSPTPTPSHAAKCTGEPTKKQILTLIDDDPGVPDAKLKVVEGPFCSGTWSFTTVALADTSKTQVEPLQVVATGKGSSLALVSLGTDVCTARVQSESPAGIRILACGF
jgi:hypothetical protein